MRIAQVRFWKAELPLTRPYTIAYRTTAAVENLFIHIETNEGVIGMGAGSAAVYVTGEKISESMAALEQHLEALLLNASLYQYQKLIQEARILFSSSPAALAAIDMALYDAFTRSLSIPLVQFLGQCHSSLPTSITIGIKSVVETIEEAKEYIGRGFNILKVKVGTNLEMDLERLRKLRAGFGEGVIIRIDANQGYDEIQLQSFVKATQDLKLEFFEQPFLPKQLDIMRALPEEIRQRCAADEDLHTLKDAVELSQPPLPYGIFNIKLMKCGGIAEALRIASVAQVVGIDLMWGCNDESIISITAALHAAFACPATKYLDLDGSLDLAKDLVSGGFQLKNGIMSIDPNLPGLGTNWL